ncbi:MAG TPA: DUF1761 domain-containing protein [Jiangellaceae bacterium]
MSQLNYWAVAVAAIAGFVAAFAYYAVLGGRLAAAGGAVTDERPPAWIPLFEVVKHLVVAAIVAGLVSAMDVTTWVGALLAGLVLWVGFPVVLLAGSVVHENVPWRVAAIHAGDWLAKLVIIALIVGVW